MILPQIKKIKSEIPELNEAQSYVREQFALINSEFIRGRYLSEQVDGVETELVVIPASDKPFQHKLGTKVLGFIVTDIRGNATVWRVNPTADEPQDLIITLRASSQVRARVWVF
jgi:hypothetical protein